jgi:4-amino-4-deoxy-L-arabinose transferase-like glycosyltransferase
MRPRRSHLVSLLVLILISAVIRWIYYQEIRDTSLFRIPQLDSEYYRNWALDLLQGDWGRGEPYWMGPLYPHLLALTYVVFGPAGAAPQLLQWLGTLASIVIVFLIALRIAGGWPACLAAFLYAFYAVPVFYAGFLLMATLLTLLFLLCLWQCLRILERPTPRRALVLGLLFGAAGLARGNMLLVGLFVPLVFWGLPLPRRRRLALTGALLLGGLLVILPVTARNMLVGHDLVLLTSNGGFNLYIGQQTEYRGTFGQQEIVLDLQADPAGELRLEKELGRSPSRGRRFCTMPARHTVSGTVTSCPRSLPLDCKGSARRPCACCSCLTPRWPRWAS